MFVKWFKITIYLGDLEVIFKQLESYNMRLNQVNCVFEVREGKFMGSQERHQYKPRSGKCN